MYEGHKRYTNEELIQAFNQVKDGILTKEVFAEMYIGRVIALTTGKWGARHFYQDIVQESLIRILQSDFNEARKPLQWLALQVFTVVRTHSRKELLLTKSTESNPLLEELQAIEESEYTPHMNNCSIDPLLDAVGLTDKERDYIESMIEGDDTDFREKYDMSVQTAYVFKKKVKDKIAKSLSKEYQRKLSVAITSKGRLVFEKTESKDGYIWGSKVLNIESGEQTRYPVFIGCACMPATNKDRAAWFKVFK